MKKARLIFLTSLVVMAIAAFKGNPVGGKDIPPISQPPAATEISDTATRN